MWLLLRRKGKDQGQGIAQGAQVSLTELGREQLRDGDAAGLRQGKGIIQAGDGHDAHTGHQALQEGDGAQDDVQYGIIGQEFPEHEVAAGNDGRKTEHHPGGFAEQDDDAVGVETVQRHDEPQTPPQQHEPAQQHAQAGQLPRTFVVSGTLAPQGYDLAADGDEGKAEIGIEQGKGHNDAPHVQPCLQQRIVSDEGAHAL